MNVLAIETSCDETAFAVIEANGGLDATTFRIVKDIVASQIETHRPWGGVVPRLAKREHEKNLPALFEQIRNSQPRLGQEIRNCDRLAVTVGPGLEPCLWSGINFTEKIYEEHFSANKRTKLVGVNHLEGHLYSFLLSEAYTKLHLKPSDIFPAIQLLVSGGHTILVLMESITDWKKLGETRDDAVGEAFDKVARMLGLPYPGGPEIEKLSNEGDSDFVEFPRPMINTKDYNFSFSGLKTSVLYYLRDHKKVYKADIAASFQKAALDVLVTKAIRAAREFGAKSVMLSGGVAANRKLRELLEKRALEINNHFFAAPAKYQTDNGVIIAIATYVNSLGGKEYEVRAQANLGL